MKNEIQLVYTVRFPAWGEKLEYPAFGVRYLVEVPIDEEDPNEFFKKAYKDTIGKDFKGEILFVNEEELVKLTPHAE